MTHNLPKTLPSFIWHFIKKQWKWLVIIQILSFAWSLDHSLWPYVIMLLIDGITNFVGDRSEMWHVLSTPIILGIGLWITVELSFRAAGILWAYVVPKLEASVRLQMFDYVQKHSYLFFSNQMAGTIANKISDMPPSMTLILQKVIMLFFPAALTMIISTILFARINLLFALLLVGWMAAHMIACLAFAKKCDQASHIHSEARSILTGKLVDSLTNSINVRLFGRHRYEMQHLSRYQQDEQTKHIHSLWMVEKLKIYLGAICFIGSGLGLNWYMLYSWQQGNITTGEVVFIFNTSWNITMMAWFVALELPSLFKEIGVCKQALTVIQSPHDLVDNIHAVPLNVHKGEISFENVTFRYRKEINLFQDKNIQIHAGEKVGLVGFSGSGKTTFVNLILRYFDVEKGRILIDGQDISKVPQESLRTQIAVIPQDPSLFHRTILENIRYGRLDASDEEVYAASKQAHCDEFIQKLPEKYHTMVGERGIKLSGGQRQRIAIARAILKGAPILILDEATSALDSVTEKEIQAGLEILMAGRTTIVVAHRLSTLSGMDRILVFKEGKIVEDGTHDELLQNEEGHYAKLWQMQTGGFLPDYIEEEEEE